MAVRHPRYIPAPIPHLCSSRVLCTPFFRGLLRLDDAAGLAGVGVRGEQVGELVCRAFGMLSLVYGLVHGDPHAGNVYATGVKRHGRGYAGIVILDHALYHRLTDADRLAFFADSRVRAAVPVSHQGAPPRRALTFAGPLWPLFPLLLSPLFALATPLNVNELRDAERRGCPRGSPRRRLASSECDALERERSDRPAPSPRLRARPLCDDRSLGGRRVVRALLHDRRPRSLVARRTARTSRRSRGVASLAPPRVSRAVGGVDARRAPRASGACARSSSVSGRRCAARRGTSAIT